MNKTYGDSQKRFTGKRWSYIGTYHRPTRVYTSQM